MAATLLLCACVPMAIEFSDAAITFLVVSSLEPIAIAFLPFALTSYPIAVEYYAAFSVVLVEPMLTD